MNKFTKIVRRFKSKKIIKKLLKQNQEIVKAFEDGWKEFQDMKNKK